MRYRSATTQDLDLLTEWNQQMIADQGHDNPMTVPQLRERMAGWIRGEYQVGLFEQDGKPVAYAVWRNQDAIVFLRQLFVTPALRRKGIGRDAMDLLSREVWPRDKRVVLEVLVGNEHAIAFWRKMGFNERYLGMERASA
jgi:ribosomal protein S18 acetylase RimI-like enzyme